MPVLDVNWNDLNALSGSDLKRQTFRVLQAASFAIQSTDTDDPNLLEVVPRLADLLDTHPDDRFRYYRDSLGLEGDELKLASSIGLETAIAIKERVTNSLDESDRLIWANWPKWPEILEVCDVFCSSQKVESFGAFNTRQLATLIDKLRKATSLKKFLLSQDQSYKGQPQNRDNIFKFLRACEYGLPQNFALVELFVRQSSPQADYSLFLGSIGSWFQPEILKELDEEGVPIQISQAFYVVGDTKMTLRNRLYEGIQNPNGALSEFEREWLRQAL